MICRKINLLYSISLFLIMSFYTLNNTKLWSGDVKILLFMGLVFGIGKMAISVKRIPQIKSRNRAFLFLLVVSGIFVFRFLRYKDTRLLIALFTMFMGIDVEPEKSIRIMFYAKLPMFLLAVLIGGYGHINGAALHGGMVVLLYICMREGNLKATDFFVILIPYLLLAVYTKSSSLVFGIGLAILALFLIKKRPVRKVLISKFMVCIFPITLILNYLFAITIRENGVPFIGNLLPDFVNKTFFQLIRWIDIATRSRITLAEASIQKFGVSLWGGNVDYGQIWPGVYFNLDSGMMWLIQGWGLLVTAVFIVMSVMLMKYLIGTRRCHYVIAALIIALWATQEDMLVSVGTNFLMIFMGQAVYYWAERNAKRYGYTQSDSLLLVRRQ